MATRACHHQLYHRSFGNTSHSRPSDRGERSYSKEGEKLRKADCFLCCLAIKSLRLNSAWFWSQAFLQPALCCHVDFGVSSSGFFWGFAVPWICAQRWLFRCQRWLTEMSPFRWKLWFTGITLGSDCKPERTLHIPCSHGSLSSGFSLLTWQV